MLNFKSKGYTAGGYGAAAKGMVLLHFVIGNDDDGSSYLDFVLDDAELKQNTYCPGTVIPVHPTSSLLQLSDPEKPLVMLVFAWNFFDEIAKRVVDVLKGSSHKGVTFLVPFPEPHVLYVDLMAAAGTSHQLLRRLPHYPTPIPNPITNDETRTKTIMVTHQRNEELLMPFFIMHHAPMFDKVVLIDFESDDHTVDIIKRFAPPSWEVVNSTTGSTFGAVATDAQVMNHEKVYPEYWQIALCTTEFLVAPNLRQTLSSVTRNETERAKSFVAQIPIFQVEGNNTMPLSYSMSLPRQRFQGEIRYRIRSQRVFGTRFLHYNTTKTHLYEAGRHRYIGEGHSDLQLDAVILKFGFAPWPEVKDRKMNVGATIPAGDVKRRMGHHHTSRLNETFINAEYLTAQTLTATSSLCKADPADEFLVRMSRIFNDVFPKMECVT